MHCVDFLIIGQGITGSLLAYNLIKLGQSVCVVDNDHYGSASKVAAGLINPITGHRLNITERFFEYSEHAQTLYWQIERDLGLDLGLSSNHRIYREINQTRLIKNAGQAEYLAQRKQQTEYQSLLNNTSNTGGWFGNSEQHPFGAIQVSKTAMVDTQQLLFSMRHWLQQRSALISAQLTYEKIQLHNNEFSFENINAKKLIFCEGYQAIHNPWLKSLPFKLAKGEILTVKPEQPVDRLLSWGNWLAPLGDGRARLGSNYVWNDTSLNAIAETPTKFMQSLTTHTSLKAELISHDVGIRPSTTQRKPFVGALSNLNNAYCLNGLGSKGCLLAPFYVTLLCQHMLENKPLPEEITRWL